MSGEMQTAGGEAAGSTDDRASGRKRGRCEVQVQTAGLSASPVPMRDSDEAIADVIDEPCAASCKRGRAA